jgi:uncharacterized cofD-like protein
VLLRGFRGTSSGADDSITAIVTVADDGGSSGRLRRAFEVLPPGDIRRCLLALSDADPTFSKLFDFRFPGEDDVGGHNLGNLILTALNQLERDFCSAIRRGGEILGARGRVLPATLERVTLVAEFADGRQAQGESQIARTRHQISRVRLEPRDALGTPEAVQAIREADLVVLAPGSLYTSLIPILLVADLATILKGCGVPIVMVMNLMTEPGETDGYTAADHVMAVRRHAPGVPIHEILLHAGPLSEDLLTSYASHGSVPVRSDVALLRAMGFRVTERDLLAPGPKIRHEPEKLAAVVIERALEVAR